jgi:ribosomal protein S18 acetylase RimI-like enzyme
MLAVPARSIGQLDRQHTADSLLVRVLNRGDLPGIERHLLTLDSASRHTRFGSAFADSSVSAYVRQIDVRRALLIGAVDGADDRIVGLAEAQPTTCIDRVEMAVSVDLPYRRKGIGRCLMIMAMTRALCRGTAIAEFFVEQDNWAAVGLIKSLGGRFGVRLGRVEVKLADWLKKTCDV